MTKNDELAELAEQPMFALVGPRATDGKLVVALETTASATAEMAIQRGDFNHPRCRPVGVVKLEAVSYWPVEQVIGALRGEGAGIII